MIQNHWMESGRKGGHLHGSGEREEREGQQLPAGPKKSKVLNGNL